MNATIINATAAGIQIRVHVQPGASKTEVAGRYGDALRVRIATPPVDGKANEALIRFLAGKLGVPRQAIEIAAGTTSRRKVVRVAGVGVAMATERLFGND